MLTPSFSTPAAILPGEADILATVLADLSDHDAKLVYADWLEEHDDRRGPFLRSFVTAYRTGKKLPAVKARMKPWSNFIGLTLMAKIRDSVLASKADRILAAVRPTIAFRNPRAAERSLPVGMSKFGGRPDMPVGTEWPKDNGVPLTFLFQLNLTELRVSPVARELPADGLLSLFCLYNYAPDFPKENWRLLYFPDTAALVRHGQYPSLLKEELAPSARLTFLEMPTLPDVDSPWGKELLRAVRGVDADGTAYRVLYEDDDMGGGDMLLGHPRPCEGDVLGKKSMRHLLTTGDHFSDTWWPDGNVVFVTLPEADLKKGRFDRASATLQCF